jgi:hypothetical protein
MQAVASKRSLAEEPAVLGWGRRGKRQAEELARDIHNLSKAERRHGRLRGGLSSRVLALFNGIY